MTKNIEKTKPGWAIPTKIKESFADFCAHIGSVTQEDSAGAHFLWQYMPERIREWAKLEAKDSPVVGKEFWPALRELIDASLQGLKESSSPKTERKAAKTG